jgi:hypothetical protein
MNVVCSLKNALQQNPQILTGLKEDLRDLCARRLRELGVNPDWKGIPAATFRQKMATLKHHQTITAKVLQINEKQVLPSLPNLDYVAT